MNIKGLNQLPSPIKIFIISYMVLMAAGMLLSLWVVVKSPVWSGSGEDTVEQMEEHEMEDPAFEAAAKAARAAFFYDSLKRAHVHHLGHVFMVFSVAGIYAFTAGKNNIKIQVIVWTAIVTLAHTLGFLIYSRLILIVFGSAYGALMGYMMVVCVVDCYKPVRNE